ncbi:hypothetical protein ACJ41O_008822 [Fusarium nematophilum]
MIESLESPYPLRHTADNELQSLAKALWGWRICADCSGGGECETLTCSWKRSARLMPFFDFYRDVTSFYVPDLLPASKPALRSHGDLLEIIQLLQNHPTRERNELTDEHFSRRETPPSPADQHRAFNLAAQVILMVKCSAENQPSGLLELGTQPMPWRSTQTLAEFMSMAFPQHDTGNLSLRDDAGRITDVKLAISAKNLKTVAGLRFEGTDDLRNHLRLDAKKGVVEIFHFTSVLKEHLTAPREYDFLPLDNLETTDHVRNIPRQIALEVLDSIQRILFPLNSDSESILRGLVSKRAFDPDCLRYHSAGYRQDGEEVIYPYFGSRLLELYEELEDPSPRGLLEKWFQRKSGARIRYLREDEFLSRLHYVS